MHFSVTLVKENSDFSDNDVSPEQIERMYVELKSLKSN